MKKIVILIIIFALPLAGCSLNKGDGNTTKGSESSLTEMPENTSKDSVNAANSSTLLSDSSISTTESSIDDATFKPNFDGIKEIMNLKKEDILNKIGTDYKIIETGAEGSQEGYYYEKYGITLVYDDFEYPDFVANIDCSDKVDIKGAKLGMKFSEIQKILGSKDIDSLKQIEQDQPNFALQYEYDNFIVWFGADTKDSSTKVLQIRRNHMKDN